MKLPADTEIAGRKTVQDWNSLRPHLVSFVNVEKWTEAYDEYFIVRLNERYLRPVESIKSTGCYGGEGFSIMTIACSLIEFLESTYQGKNYRYRKKSDPPLTTHEYDKSGDLFCDFLTKRIPFSQEFDAAIADSFYREVRCGLLHEARTKGDWTIWGRSPNATLISIKPNENIVYRDDFFDALQIWISKDFRQQLVNSNQLKEAFIRKFDRLCQS